MSAVVHHGGAGTTGAGLRAGVPSIVTPVVADQPNWAMRLAALGVGPRPTPFKDLTVDRLANAIHQATSDQAVPKRATDLGEMIRSEDGIQTAIDEFLAFARRPTASSGQC
jgi:sterol 3beta-glucosyltransferase